MNDEVTERILAAVEAAGLTPNKVHDLTGIGYWKWTRRVRGDVEWTTSEVTAIARATRVPFWWLARGEVAA